MAAAVARGTSYGTPTEPEVELAEEIVARTPIDKVRFVSSGTEATMSAIRLARGVTGRDVVVKFAGCYHGHVDSLLAAAGSGLATFAPTFALPGTPGVPASSTALTLVLPYNDREAVAAAFAEHGDRIACLITEAAPGNMGVVPPLPGFNAFLAETCAAHGALFVSDEVMTGFRASRLGQWGLDGAAEGWKPDLMTFGKVMGGGLPAAAFGGRADVMSQLAPEGPVYQAGTLSGNPVATTAGLATLRLATDEVYDRLSLVADTLQHRRRQGAHRGRRTPRRAVDRARCSRCSSPADPVLDFAAASTQDTAAYAAFFHAMLERRGAPAPLGLRGVVRLQRPRRPRGRGRPRRAARTPPRRPPRPGRRSLTMVDTIVHVLRHGEVHNPEGILYGRRPGYRLSELGRAMAERVAESVRDRDIVHLGSSPLERAQETAAPHGEAARARRADRPPPDRVDQRLRGQVLRQGGRRAPQPQELVAPAQPVHALVGRAVRRRGHPHAARRSSTPAPPPTATRPCWSPTSCRSGSPGSRPRSGRSSTTRASASARCAR